MKFSKTKWIKFAKETLKNDGTVDQIPNLGEFGEWMARVYAKEGTIESVLWDGPNPSGTEDRTWVRVYMCLKGFPAYSGILGGLDGHHANRIKNHFQEVLK